MRVVVVGGTGIIGRLVMVELTEAGHLAVSASRSGGVDVVAGTGLDPVLAGADAVIDVVEFKTFRKAAATAAFGTAARQLAAAEHRAGVGRHVLLSVVNIDDPRLAGFGYYQGKLAQEQAVRNSGIPATVVRSTQWYEFPEKLISLMRLGPVALIPRERVRPVAARSVAAQLVSAATGDHRERIEIAGPDEYQLPEMARTILARRGVRKKVLPVPFVGAARAVAAGALLPGPGALIDTVTLDQWLATGPVAVPPR